MENRDNKNQGVYYEPPVDFDEKSLKKKNPTPIIVTLIICGAVVLSVIIICLFAFIGNRNVNPIEPDPTNANVVTSAEVEAKKVTSIQIEWVDGDVNIEYYDGDTISFSETESKVAMDYRVEAGKLIISEFPFDVSKKGIKLDSKNLTLQLPKDFETTKIKLELVNANVKATGLKSTSVKVETVVGNVDLSFDTQPVSIDVETVTGDITLRLPEDIKGYRIDKDSIASSVDTTDFGDGLTYGDSSMKIDYESVSGSLTICKNK